MTMHNILYHFKFSYSYNCTPGRAITHSQQLLSTVILNDTFLGTLVHTLQIATTIFSGIPARTMITIRVTSISRIGESVYSGKSTCKGEFQV